MAYAAKPVPAGLFLFVVIVGGGCMRYKYLGMAVAYVPTRANFVGHIG